MDENINRVQVLMFGWELPPHNSGGLGVACYGLTKGLAAQGAQISFALPRKMDTTLPFMKVLGYDLKNVQVTAINSLLQAYMEDPRYAQYHSAIRREYMKLYGQNLYAEALRFGEMAREWSSSQPHQVIHCHDWMTFPAGMKAKEKSGKPLVTHVHATEFDRTGGNVNQIIAEMEYEGVHQADKVIAVSHYTKNIIMDKYAVPADKIEVIHNGIDLNEFSPMNIRKIFPHDQVVLFVGRLTFQKGVDYFLRAAQLTLNKRPNTVFLVVGSGDMERKLIMEAAYMGIGDRVLFPGFLSGDSLRAVYQMADVFVMPSVSEPYGIVALEALATGTPTIISKQSGVAETLSHVHAVNFWDVEQMSQMICSVLSYPQLAAEMTRLAKMEAAQMTWEKAAHKAMRVYQSLIH